MNQFCFLLGIMPRSGTNYLENILSLHNDCVTCTPIYEDFLISQSGLLLKYSKQVSRFWNPKWDESNKYLDKDILLKNIGNGLLNFLSNPITDKNNHIQDTHGNKKTILSKTPSVKNIHNFFKLFPTAKVIILIRDGRAIVESGCKSFDWNFEKACYDWGKAVKNIENFIANNPEKKDQIKVVKYEDILTNTEIEVNRIFDFLKLDKNIVAVDDIHNLDISGSSETRNKSDKVTWKPVKMNDEFNPLNRFSHWGHYKKRRFEWISGKQLLSMGYCNSIDSFSFSEKLFHSLLDVTWSIRVVPSTLKYLLLHKNFILKTY